MRRIPSDEVHPEISKIDVERVRAAQTRTDWRERDSAFGVTEKQVVVRLIDTYHKSGETRSFRIESDEPPAVGGKNLAPQPTEFMLMSLGFCQMSMIVWCAGRMRIELDDVEITVTGYRDDRGLLGTADVRPGYYLIEMETKLVSEAPAERLAKLVALSEKSCPVFDNLSTPTPMRSRVLAGDEVVHEAAVGLAAPACTPARGT